VSAQQARLAVFASGGGTNLQALLDHFNARDESIARVQLVVASRPGIGALERARAAGVSTVVVAPGESEPGELLGCLREAGIDLIALAGYIRLVPPEVVASFRGRILNIHPALLPAFGGRGMYGRRVHEAVLASGTRVTGATVHFVDERYDEGPILGQWPVPVLPGDTPEQLAARVLRVEHILYPLAVERLLRGERWNATTGEAFDLVDAASPTEASVRRLLG